MAYRTKYVPLNQQKYVGNPDSIHCRSLWERSVCKFCDVNENIVKWSFEEIMVPYHNPVDNKIRNYIPDFLVQIKNNDQVESWMIECVQRPEFVNFVLASVLFLYSFAKIPIPAVASNRLDNLFKLFIISADHATFNG